MRSFPRLVARPTRPAAAFAGLALLAVAANACAAQSPSSAPSPSVTAQVTSEAPAPSPAKFGGGLYPASAERIVKFNDLAGDTLILGSTDQKGDKACMVDLEGRDPRSGTRRWKTTLRLALPVRGASCRYGLPDGTGTTLFATTSEGRPQVFDLRQGRVRWRGPQAGTIVAGDERVVMVRDDPTARLTLYDLRTGKARWSIEGPADTRNDVTVQLTGERLLVWESGYDGCASVPAGPHGCVDVFDLSDGTKTLTTDGAAAGYGAGWVAARARTDDGATFSLYDTA